MNTSDLHQLSPEDQAAFEALIEARWQADDVAEPHQQRARRIAQWLELTSFGPETAPDDLTARTLSRLTTPTTASLCDDDAAALDALVETGFSTRGLSSHLKARGEKLLSLLHTLDQLPEQRPGDLLTPRTLRAIESATAPRAESVEPLLGSGFRLREVAVVAAMALITVSLMWPMLTGLRVQAREAACRTHLGNAYNALAHYAQDFAGNLPATKAHLGDPWGLTNQFNEDGSALSNSAHLFVSLTSGHADTKDLTCPENAGALTEITKDMRDWPDSNSTSFSYQNQYTKNKTRLAQLANVALLADKNPFFVEGEYRLGLKRDTNSLNHAGGGQNALMADGSAMWLDEPRLLNRDNIYHAGLNGADYYTGLEGPADERDSFLVP